MQEEQLKNRIAETYFSLFDTTNIIGKIDFCAAQRMPRDAYEMGEDVRPLLWAEAKSGTRVDIYDSLVQLVLTIGKARTYERVTPPNWLGAFDEEKIAFVPYGDVGDVFFQSDFNWNVAPSDHGTREFAQLRGIVEKSLSEGARVFYYSRHDAELRDFIRQNIGTGEMRRIEITKNNFTSAYLQWVETVMPTIDLNWEVYGKVGIISADFFLADLMSTDDNKTIVEKLQVQLDDDRYRMKVVSVIGFGRKDPVVDVTVREVEFLDGQKAHTAFWNKWARPPKKLYRGHIIDRRDLLVPQDIREREGAFFTPQKWVRLSQQYIAKTLGEDWQEEYYVWDCCAGTGNLLVGLTHPSRVFASTLNQADVDAMMERIDKGASLLPEHVFQFDFLNDSFSDPKVPKDLRNILEDERKRKKLVIYINPPYAEATKKSTVVGTGNNKAETATETAVYKSAKYKKMLGKAVKELFAQFFMRIYEEIGGAVLAEFSKLKIHQAPNFTDFRNVFRADLKSLFLVPAATFDNVSGQFPIGFFIWDTRHGSGEIGNTVAEVYNANGDKIEKKKILCCDYELTINKWLKRMVGKKVRPQDGKAYLRFVGNDFQNQNYVFVINGEPSAAHSTNIQLDGRTLKPCAIYYAVRKVIAADWLNDRDQFYEPTGDPMRDEKFANDCLVYLLFNNSITTEKGVNDFIPYGEDEVGAHGLFESYFMTDYIKGKVARWDEYSDDVFQNHNVMPSKKPLKFGKEAKAVMEAGKELWRYYHSKAHTDKDYNVNASYYDIRKYFQSDKDGKRGATSKDEKYNELMETLRSAMSLLNEQIAEKVYEYGFLRG